MFFRSQLLVAATILAACGIEPGAPASPSASASPDGGPLLGDAGEILCSPACGPGQVCSNGVCQKDCAAGKSACGAVCFDLLTSSAHCGSCGNACGVAEYCNGGRCVEPGCANGVQDPGETGIDCGSVCPGAACALVPPNGGTSCKGIKAATPTSTDGIYAIDPDGAGAAAPFEVFCDMTTGGGGWTALPLRFADAAFWTVTASGSPNVTFGAKTNAGVFEQYHSVVDGALGTTALRFVPPMPMNEVRFVDLDHSPSGSCNSMDFAIGTGVLGANTSHEAWYFSDTDPAAVRGVVFATDASCTAPYVLSPATQSTPASCSRDTNLGTAYSPLNVTVVYSAPATVFQMVLVQGGGSSTCASLPDGERLYINTPPAADGKWRKGILVR